MLVESSVALDVGGVSVALDVGGASVALDVGGASVALDVGGASVALDVGGASVALDGEADNRRTSNKESYCGARIISAVYALIYFH